MMSVVMATAGTVYVLGPAVLTPHLVQNFVVARLHRQIDVLADFWQVCDGLNYLLGHELGVGGQETDAFNTVYIVQSGKQFGQAGIIRQIMAVGIHGLT